jgi:colicin import membrane protein
MKAINHQIEFYSDDYKSSFMLAIALHLFLILIAFIVGRVLHSQYSRDAGLEIIQASVRVDVVGMPKMTLKELKELESMPVAPVEEPKVVEASKTEEVKPEIKPDDLVVPDESAPKRKSLTSFLTDYSSQKVKVDTKTKKGDKAAKLQGLDSLIIEGNRISKGTALVGSNSDMADSVFVGYVQRLPERVREHWRLPGYLKEQELKCRMHVWIGVRGEILRTEVRESSGNNEFDSRAEAAIRAAAPFTVPPPEVAPKLATRGIILGFPL